MKQIHQKELLNSYEYITNIANTIKCFKEGYTTNFFIGEDRCNLLIRNKLLYAISYEKCIFILHKDYDFFHLYYICSNEKILSDFLKVLSSDYSDHIFIVDIVGIKPKVEITSLIFSQSGFNKYTLLHRMSRIKNLDEIQNFDSKAEYAASEHAVQIHSLFERYFDKYSEQIPLLEEIINFIDTDNVLVTTEQKKVTGFVIFEITGMTSYLRYWFVLPEYRNEKIGSILLRRFFHEARNTKRQIFWVLASNENAIVRYKHYGFEVETMIDQVMIKYPLKS
jgi:ribosomal protein S18 acetylase RimI-like enzyme